MSARLAKCPGCKKAFTLPNFSRPGRAECPRCGTHFTWPLEGKDKNPKKKPHGLRGSEDPLLGEEFGGCKMIELLGHGSLGSIYRAEHMDEGNDIAIKILPPFLVKRFAQFVTRYMAQSHRVADLNHPNVVPVYQVGEHRGFIFTTMKFIDGKSLAECIGKRKTVKPESAVRVARSAAFGLRAMSDSGVLHRNLKPGNILLGGDSKVLVSDFGLGPGSSAELKGSVFGTAVMNPEYLSPEQAANDSIDCRSDIYSLGAILYRMLTGYTPFDELEGGSRRALLTPPIERNPKVAEDVNKVICRMMEYRPEDRYPTWNEVIDDLDSLFNGTPSELPTQISDEPAPKETTDLGADTTDTERHEAVQQILSMLPDSKPREPLTEEESAGPPIPEPQEKETPGFVETNTQQELTRPQTSPPNLLPTEEQTLPPTLSPFYNPDTVETIRSHENIPTLQDEDNAKTIEAVELLAKMEQTISYTDTDATVEDGTSAPAEPDRTGEGQLEIDSTFDRELTQQLANLQKGPDAPATVDEIERTVTYVSDANEVGLPVPPPPQSLAPPPTQQALEPLPDEQKPQIQFPFGGNYETPPAEFASPQSKLELDAPSQHLTPAAPLTTLQGELPVQTVQTVRRTNSFGPHQRSGVFERKRMAREKETIALMTAVITSAIFVLGASVFWSMRTSEPSKKTAQTTVRRPTPKAKNTTPRTKKQNQPVDRSVAIKRSVTNRINQTIAVHKWGEAIRSMENFARTQTDRSMENWAAQMAQRVQARARDEYNEIMRRAEGALKNGDQDEACDLYRIVFLNYDLEPFVAQARNKYAALLEAGTETAQPVREIPRPQPKKEEPTKPVLDRPNFIILDSLVAQWRFADALKQCNEYLDTSRYETSPEFLSLQETIDLLPRLKHTIIEFLNRSQNKPKIDNLTEPVSTGKIFRATDRSLTVQSGVKVSALPWARLHAAGVWQLAMSAVSPSNYKMRLAAVVLTVEMDSPAVAAKEVERLKSIGVDVTLYHQRIEHRRSERLKRLGVE